MMERTVSPSSRRSPQSAAVVVVFTFEDSRRWLQLLSSEAGSISGGRGPWVSWLLETLEVGVREGLRGLQAFPGGVDEHPADEVDEGGVLGEQQLSGSNCTFCHFLLRSLGKELYSFLLNSLLMSSMSLAEGVPSTCMMATSCCSVDSVLKRGQPLTA